MSDDIVKRLREWDRQYEGKMPNDMVIASDLIEYLRQQLAAALAAIKIKDAALQSAISAHRYESGDLHEALAATADLDGLILCHAEPVAWQTFDGEGGYDYRSYEDNEDYRDDYIKRNSSQKFYENWVIPLYRAWEPK